MKMYIIILSCLQIAASGIQTVMAIFIINGPSNLVAAALMGRIARSSIPFRDTLCCEGWRFRTVMDFRLQRQLFKVT